MYGKSKRLNTQLRFPRLLACLILVLAVLLNFGITRQASAEGKSQATGLTNNAPDVNCTMAFSDVRPTDYFYESVRALFCMGAIGGYSDGTFRPNTVSTRGQLSKIIAISKGWALLDPPSPSFPDVQRDNTFYTYVETARAHGIISGYSDGTFRPNANVTRGQIAKVVVLTEGWPLLYPGRATFNDVATNSPFFTYVETAVAHGVISGYADGSFRAGTNATRGQISKMIYLASSSTVLTAEERQTVDLINQRRAGMGLGQLQVNMSLTQAARRHSSDIGPARLCQHEGTDGSSPWDRIAQAGYAGFAMGEVVGCNFASAQGVVDGWWNSPGHYGILVDPTAVNIGCGWWIGPDGYGWQTCDTGR